MKASCVASLTTQVPLTHPPKSCTRPTPPPTMPSSDHPSETSASSTLRARRSPSSSCPRPTSRTSRPPSSVAGSTASASGSEAAATTTRACRTCRKVIGSSSSTSLLPVRHGRCRARHGLGSGGCNARRGLLYHREKNRTVGFSAGTCPTVGVGGHLSGGGLGTLSRKYGTAADNIVDARLVDVNGRILDRQSMGEDYFWAIRGGGAASFGIVLSYKIELNYVPPIVTAFNVIRALKQDAAKLVTKWQQIGPNLDENLYMRVITLAKDDDEAEGNRTIEAIFNSLYLGRCEELLTVMGSSFPELGFEAADCNEMSWLESVLFFNNDSGRPTEVLLDRKQEFYISFKAKSDFVREPVTEIALEEIWRFLMEAKDEPLMLFMEPFGGVLNEIPESATPFPYRKGNLYMIQYFMWWLETDMETTERHLSWMRKLYAFMTPYVSKNPRAAYLNYKDIDLGRTARVWGPKYFKNNFNRLAYVKSKVDPHNFFRNEQSIPPIKSLLDDDTQRERERERESILWYHMMSSHSNVQLVSTLATTENL
ncbi:unnamed protein product [Musa textilis]